MDFWKGIVGFSVAIALAPTVSQATTYKCKFQKDKIDVGNLCTIDTTNPNVTCTVKFSNTLQGSCGGNKLGPSDLLACAFHDPKVTAAAAIQSLSARATGEANLAAPAGFVSGSAAIANPVQAFAIGYVEKKGAPQLNGGCGP